MKSRQDERGLGRGGDETSLSWEKPTEIDNVIERLKTAGKIGAEISDLISLISSDTVHFATLNKQQYIEYMYAGVIAIQALFELLLKQTKPTDRRGTISQIKVQLGALELFTDQIAIETFMHENIRVKIERTKIVIHSLSSERNLKRNSFITGMGYSK